MNAFGSIWRTEFFSQHTRDKLKAEDSGEKAAVDQKLQIHIKIQEIWQRTLI